MKVKVKKVDQSIETVIPKYAKEGDAGLDFMATSVTETPDFIEYGTNIAVEIPAGHVGLMFPRSSISKYDLALCNAVGVVDSGYRGEVKFRFKRTKPAIEQYTDMDGDTGYRLSNAKTYQVGDKIGQLIILPYPSIELEFTEELSDTERGNGGFGSSGT